MRTTAIDDDKTLKGCEGWRSGEKGRRKKKIKEALMEGANRFRISRPPSVVLIIFLNRFFSRILIPVGIISTDGYTWF